MRMKREKNEKVLDGSKLVRNRKLKVIVWQVAYGNL